MSHGVWMGLSFTQKIVKKMNGRIEVSSKKYEGTTFTVYI